jgi:hypothetical protein
MTIALIATVLVGLALFWAITKKEKYTWKPILITPESICKTYDRKPVKTIIGGEIPYIPTRSGDCPDSSFTFVNNLGKWVPGAKGSGCIQLKTISYPFCYNSSPGKFTPNYYKMKNTTF